MVASLRVWLNRDTIKYGVLLLAVVGVALQPGDRWSNFRWWWSLGKARSSHDFASLFTGMVGLVVFPDTYIAVDPSVVANWLNLPPCPCRT